MRPLAACAAVYYALSAGLMTVYGGLVCPFVEALPAWKWAAVLVAGYLAAFAVRLRLDAANADNDGDLREGPRQFALEMGLAAGLGLALAVFNTLAFDFPAESGLKILLGTICAGFFMALDLTLARERMAAGHGGRPRDSLPEMPFSSLTGRLSVLASLVAVFNAAIVILVVYKDILYLQGLPPHEVRSQAVYVALEILFVSLVVLAFTLRVVWSYARNLRMAFSAQTSTLQAVRDGNLDVYVPVVSADEFGRIAHDTNTMISGLRERRHMQSVLGKVVDTRIADKLIRQSHKGLTLGGTRHDAIVFMSDIRDFTAFSESAEPEAVLADLNVYFSECVRIITGHGGMVDKFIGDGMLAVFGLIEHEQGVPCTCADDALRAAFALLDGLPGINDRMEKPVRIGMGLHAGPVVSGLMGAPERMEYTVIGDTVNTAARLESLCKTLETPLVVSGALYARLTDDTLRARLKTGGGQALKGRHAAVEVWTLR